MAKNKTEENKTEDITEIMRNVRTFKANTRQIVWRVGDDGIAKQRLMDMFARRHCLPVMNMKFDDANKLIDYRVVDGKGEKHVTYTLDEVCNELGWKSVTFNSTAVFPVLLTEADTDKKLDYV